MRISKSQQREQWRAVALFFALFAIFLIGFSLILKTILIFAATQFDGEHQFVIEVQQSQRKADIIVSSPDTQSLGVLSVTGETTTSFAKQLGIPVAIHIDSPLVASSPQELLSQVIFHSPHATQLTIVDKIRLFFFTMSLNPKNITQESLTLPTDPQIVDKTVGSLVADHTIYMENESIGIVNATGVAGLGNAASHMLGLIGANVISVTTATDLQQKTVLVYTGKLSYTAKRVASISNAELKQTTVQGLSDMTLILGKDNASRFSL